MVFVESDLFKDELFALYKQRKWNPSIYQEFQNAVIDNPTGGDFVPRCNGIQKWRWETSSDSKRSGVRIYLYYWERRQQVLLFDIYAKSDQEDITERQKKELAKIAQKLK